MPLFANFRDWGTTTGSFQGTTHTFAIPYAAPYALLRCCQENTSRFRDIFFVDDSALIAPQGVGVDSLTGLKNHKKICCHGLHKDGVGRVPCLEGEGCDQEEAGARSDPQSVNFMPGLNWNCGKSPLCPQQPTLSTATHFARQSTAGPH